MELKSITELAKLKAKFEKIVIKEDVHTVEDVARVCRCPEAVVIKSLLFVGKEPVMVLVPGDKKVNLTDLKKVTNDSTLTMAKPKEVVKLTKYHVGTVSPFGHNLANIIADIKLRNLSYLIVGSGKSDILIKISYPEFVKVYKGSFEAVTT